MDDILRVFFQKQLISQEAIQAIFPEKSVSSLAFHQAPQDITLENIGKGLVLPHSSSDIEAMTHIIESTNLGPDTIPGIISCITNSLATEFSIQGQLVKLLLQVFQSLFEQSINSCYS